MRKLLMLIGGLTGVAMVAGALWVWRHAVGLSMDAAHPEIAVWSARCAAVGLAALGQIALLVFWVGWVYRRSLFDDLLRVTAVLIFAVSLVSAMALGLAG